jgi:hypothetical protein
MLMPYGVLKCADSPEGDGEGWESLFHSSPVRWGALAVANDH